MDKSAKICSSEFSIGWLLEKLENAGINISSVRSWTAKPIGEGEGFLSGIFLVKLDWDNSLPGVVVKIPKVDLAKQFIDTESASSSFDEWIKIGHIRECAAYECLGLETDISLPVPKLFYHQFIADNQTGVIVMEYIENTALVDIVGGFTLEQMESIMESLAKLHAAALQWPDDWTAKFDQENAERVFPVLFDDMAADVATKLRPIRPEFYDKYLAGVIKKFTGRQMFEWGHNAHKELGMKPILVEGDFWANNIMLERDSSGSPGSKVVSVVDWQFAHPGACMEDISVLLASCCSGEFRRKHAANLVKCYYEKLSLHCPDGAPFSFEQVQQTYDKLMPNALIFTLIAFAFLIDTVQGKDPQNRSDKYFERIRMLVEDVWPDCIA